MDKELPQQPEVSDMEQTGIIVFSGGELSTAGIRDVIGAAPNSADDGPDQLDILVEDDKLTFSA